MNLMLFSFIFRLILEMAGAIEADVWRKVGLNKVTRNIIVKDLATEMCGRTSRYLPFSICIAASALVIR